MFIHVFVISESNSSTLFLKDDFPSSCSTYNTVYVQVVTIQMFSLTRCLILACSTKVCSFLLSSLYSLRSLGSSCIPYIFLLYIPYIFLLGCSSGHSQLFVIFIFNLLLIKIQVHMQVRLKCCYFLCNPSHLSFPGTPQLSGIYCMSMVLVASWRIVCISLV